MDRACIQKMIDQERERQDDLHGPGGGMPHYTDGERYCVLGEEFGEVGHAINESDWSNLTEELVQTAAVCVAWLETI